jgi:hypothetical protein
MSDDELGDERAKVIEPRLPTRDGDEAPLIAVSTHPTRVLAEQIIGVPGWLSRAASLDR